MVGINTSMGAVAYGKSSQLGGQQAQQREVAHEEARLKNARTNEVRNEAAIKKREEKADDLKVAPLPTPPEKVQASRQEADENSRSAPRGSIVDIQV